MTRPAELETKAALGAFAPLETKSAFSLDGEPEGTAWALVAVTGVQDDVADIITPGAFTRTLGIRDIKGCLGHDWNRPVARADQVIELMPGDPRLPATLADEKTPWPAEAGALAVKASYNLATKDGRDAYQHARFFGKKHGFSIGYKVARTRKINGVRHIDDLDLYEFSPVLHGANRLATLMGVKGAEADLETGDLGGTEVKIAYVRDADYWGRPVGTPITANMKPRGKVATALRRKGKRPSPALGAAGSRADAERNAAPTTGRAAPAKVQQYEREIDDEGLFPEPAATGRLRAERTAKGDEQTIDKAYGDLTASLSSEVRDGEQPGPETRRQRDAAVAKLLKEGEQPDDVEERLHEELADDLDGTDDPDGAQERLDDFVSSYRTAAKSRATEQETAPDKPAKPGPAAKPGADTPEAPVADAPAVDAPEVPAPAADVPEVPAADAAFDVDAFAKEHGYQVFASARTPGWRGVVKPGQGASPAIPILAVGPDGKPYTTTGGRNAVEIRASEVEEYAQIREDSGVGQPGSTYGKATLAAMRKRDGTGDPADEPEGTDTDPPAETFDGPEGEMDDPAADEPEPESDPFDVASNKAFDALTDNDQDALESALDDMGVDEPGDVADQIMSGGGRRQLASVELAARQEWDAHADDDDEADTPEGEFDGPEGEMDEPAAADEEGDDEPEPLTEAEQNAADAERRQDALDAGNAAITDDDHEALTQALTDLDVPNPEEEAANLLVLDDEVAARDRLAKLADPNAEAFEGPEGEMDLPETDDEGDDDPDAPALDDAADEGDEPAADEFEGPEGEMDDPAVDDGEDDGGAADGLAARFPEIEGVTGTVEDHDAAPADMDDAELLRAVARQTHLNINMGVTQDPSPSLNPMRERMAALNAERTKRNLRFTGQVTPAPENDTPSLPLPDGTTMERNPEIGDLAPRGAIARWDLADPDPDTETPVASIYQIDDDSYAIDNGSRSTQDIQSLNMAVGMLAEQRKIKPAGPADGGGAGPTGGPGDLPPDGAGAGVLPDGGATATPDAPGAPAAGAPGAAGGEPRPTAASELRPGMTVDLGDGEQRTVSGAPEVEGNRTYVTFDDGDRIEMNSGEQVDVLADGPAAESPEAVPAEGDPLGEGEAKLTADDLAAAEDIEADQLGLVEGDDGEFEVTAEAGDRQDRVEAVLEAAAAGDTDITKLADDDVTGTRKDLVEELRLQEAIRRREARRRRGTPDTPGDGPADTPDGPAGGTDTPGETDTPDTPDTPPTPPRPPRPKPVGRPGLAGAMEDYADALESGDEERKGAALARLRTSANRSKGDSPAHRELAELLDAADGSEGSDPDPAKLRELATAIRDEAKRRRNTRERDRRAAKRIERDRLRGLIGQYDAEIRRRNLGDPDTFGGSPPPAGAPDAPAGDVDTPPIPDGPGAGPAVADTPAPGLTDTPDAPPAPEPAGGPAVTAMVDSVEAEPRRLIFSDERLAATSDPDLEAQAANAAFSTVVAKWAPTVRARSDDSLEMVRRGEQPKGASNAHPDGIAFALLLPAEQRGDFMDDMRGAVGNYRTNLASLRAARDAPPADRPASADVPPLAADSGRVGVFGVMKAMGPRPMANAPAGNRTLESVADAVAAIEARRVPRESVPEDQRYAWGAADADRTRLIENISGGAESYLSRGGGLLAYRDEDGSPKGWRLVQASTGITVSRFGGIGPHGGGTLRELQDTGQSYDLDPPAMRRLMDAYERMTDARGNQVDWTADPASVDTSVRNWQDYEPNGGFAEPDPDGNTDAMGRMRDAALLTAMRSDPGRYANTRAFALAADRTQRTNQADPALTGNRPGGAELTRSVDEQFDLITGELNNGRRRSSIRYARDRRDRAAMKLDGQTAASVNEAKLRALGGEPEVAVTLLRNAADNMRAAGRPDDAEAGLLSPRRLDAMADQVAETFTPDKTETERLLTAKAGDRIVLAEPEFDSETGEPVEITLNGPPALVSTRPDGTQVYSVSASASGRSLTVGTDTPDSIEIEIDTGRNGIRINPTEGGRRTSTISNLARDNWALYGEDEFSPPDVAAVKFRSRRSIEAFDDLHQTWAKPRSDDDGGGNGPDSPAGGDGPDAPGGGAGQTDTPTPSTDTPETDTPGGAGSTDTPPDAPADTPPTATPAGQRFAVVNGAPADDMDLIKVMNSTPVPTSPEEAQALEVASGQQVGDVVLVRGHGRLRPGIVTKVGPKRTTVAFTTPGAVNDAMKSNIGGVQYDNKADYAEYQVKRWQDATRKSWEEGRAKYYGEGAKERELAKRRAEWRRRMISVYGGPGRDRPFDEAGESASFDKSMGYYTEEALATSLADTEARVRRNIDHDWERVEFFRKNRIAPFTIANGPHSNERVYWPSNRGGGGGGGGGEPEPPTPEPTPGPVVVAPDPGVSIKMGQRDLTADASPMLVRETKAGDLVAVPDGNGGQWVGTVRSIGTDRPGLNGGTPDPLDALGDIAQVDLIDGDGAVRVLALPKGGSLSRLAVREGAAIDLPDFDTAPRVRMGIADARLLPSGSALRLVHDDGRVLAQGRLIDEKYGNGRMMAVMIRTTDGRTVDVAALSKAQDGEASFDVPLDPGATIEAPSMHEGVSVDIDKTFKLGDTVRTMVRGADPAEVDPEQARRGDYWVTGRLVEMTPADGAGNSRVMTIELPGGARVRQYIYGEEDENQPRYYRTRYNYPTTSVQRVKAGTREDIAHAEAVSTISSAGDSTSDAVRGTVGAATRSIDSNVSNVLDNIEDGDPPSVRLREVIAALRDPEFDSVLDGSSTGTASLEFADGVRFQLNPGGMTKVIDAIPVADMFAYSGPDASEDSRRNGLRLMRELAVHKLERVAAAAESAERMAIAGDDADRRKANARAHRFAKATLMAREPFADNVAQSLTESYRKAIGGRRIDTSDGEAFNAGAAQTAVLAELGEKFAAPVKAAQGRWADEWDRGQVNVRSTLEFTPAELDQMNADIDAALVKHYGRGAVETDPAALRFFRGTLIGDAMAAPGTEPKARAMMKTGRSTRKPKAVALTGEGNAWRKLATTKSRESLVPAGSDHAAAMEALRGQISERGFGNRREYRQRLAADSLDAVLSGQITLAESPHVTVDLDPGDMGSGATMRRDLAAVRESGRRLVERARARSKGGASEQFTSLMTALDDERDAANVEVKAAADAFNKRVDELLAKEGEQGGIMSMWLRRDPASSSFASFQKLARPGQQEVYDRIAPQIAPLRDRELEAGKRLIEVSGRWVELNKKRAEAATKEAREAYLAELSAIRPMGLPDDVMFEDVVKIALPAKRNPEKVRADMMEALKVYPSDWLRAAAQVGSPITVTYTEARAHFQGNKTGAQINIGDGSVGTLTHEFGHWMQRVIPGLSEAEFAVHYDRTATGEAGSRKREKVMKMGTMMGYSGFGKHEKGMRDDWPNAYTGKTYEAFGDGTTAGGVGTTREVFTTSIEDVANGNGVKDGKGSYLDEDLREWIFGVMATIPGAAGQSGAGANPGAGQAR